LQECTEKTTKKLEKNSRSRWGTNGFRDTAPNIFSSRTKKEEMMNYFILITKLTLEISCSASFRHGVFFGNGIVPNKPEPDLDFQRNFGFPKMFE
jgi:hypothetical protein